MLTKQLSAASVHLSLPETLRLSPTGSPQGSLGAQLFVGSASPKVVHVFNVDAVIKAVQDQPEMLRSPQPSLVPLCSNRPRQNRGRTTSSERPVLDDGPSPCVVAANSALQVCVTVDNLAPESRESISVQKFNTSPPQLAATASQWTCSEELRVFVQRGTDDGAILCAVRASMPCTLYCRLAGMPLKHGTTGPPRSVVLICFRRRIVAVSVDEDAPKELAVWMLQLTTANTA